MGEKPIADSSSTPSGSLDPLILRITSRARRADEAHVAGMCEHSGERYRPIEPRTCEDKVVVGTKVAIAKIASRRRERHQVLKGTPLTDEGDQQAGDGDEPWSTEHIFLGGCECA